MEKVELTPERVDWPAMSFAGIDDMYTMETTGEIPKQWKRFDAELTQLEQKDRATYGVVVAERGLPMRYYTAIEAREVGEMPVGWELVDVAPAHYAVFKGYGGPPEMKKMWTDIWTAWLPTSGMQPTAAPMLEIYEPGYDVNVGGEWEICIPVVAKD
jgi:predicted transcriptional regulator YdeE